MSGTQHIPLNPPIKWNFLFTNWSEYFFFFMYYCWIFSGSMKFYEFLKLEAHCRQEGQTWLRFFRNVLCELNSEWSEIHGSWVSWVVFSVVKKSSRFLSDLNYSCVKWDGKIDLPPINILFGNGEVICRELVAVVKWYPGTALEGSYFRSNLHLLKLNLVHGLYAKLWTF